jgi:Sec-independent protein secretion pathway component TatC
MESMLRRWIEITFIVLIVAWVLTRPQAFSQVVRALSAGYAQSVGALMPRR